MITKLRLVLSFTILMAGFYSFGQTNYWNPVSGVQTRMPVHLEKLDNSKARFFTLDRNALSAVLGSINNTSNTNTVYFPDAKGNIVPFKIKEASVMAPALTAKYPEIRSYKGHSLDGKEDRIRISISPKGVQTMIVHKDDGKNTYMSVTATEGTYVVYQKSAEINAKSTFVCGTYAFLQEKAKASTARLVDDQTLRKYRIAVSTTGEYTLYHGGVDNALAAINATLTRVNEVFETDLGITLELIANNIDVIYPNPDTDPYGTSLNSEVQNTLTTVIGEENYDVGHLFHRDFNNGNAGFIGAVCVDGQKGSAFSAGEAPEGDLFDVDFVAHELGHQFGANHTWSFTTEGTGVQAEPASGTTIMAYAGIVPGNNVQNTADDHFHYNSITQITDYIATTTCAVDMPIGNNPPVIAAGQDSFVIPKLTAFVLERIATDPDAGDDLTYCWEQIDDGIVTTETFGPNNPIGANFRSLPPTSEPARYFPRLSEVAQGNLTQTNPATDSAWETVSGVPRQLNFALTVRDNADGGGQLTSEEVQVEVVSSAGPFEFTSLADPETITAGSTKAITWDVANTNVAPVNAQMVDILLSLDGGASFTEILTDTPNDGNEEVLIPAVSSSQARFIIKASDNIFFAMNAADIVIEDPANLLLEFSRLDYEVCQPDDLVIPFTYRTFGGFSEVATFSVVNAPAGLGVSFNPATATADDTSVELTLSSTDLVAAGNYEILVRAETTSETVDVTLDLSILNSTFGAVTLTSPADGATDISFSNAILGWEADENVNSYEIEVATDGGFTNIVDSGTSIFNSYKASSLQESTTYFWRVKPVNNCGEGTFSATFSFTTIGVDCRNIAANGLPKEIITVPNIVTASILIIDNLPVADVNVGVNLNHTWLADMIITLRSPSGTEVPLLINSCGDLQDMDVIFDDQAANPVQCDDSGSGPAISGEAQPLGQLSAFNGELAAGEWVLIVDDQFNEDGGSLNEFTLELCLEGAFEPDTDGDGIIDINDLCPNTPPGAEVNTDGCEVFRFAVDNFEISVDSESCIGNNDGKINVTAEMMMNYTATLTGNGVDDTANFTDTYQSPNLSGGNYTLCITATDGNDVYEELCFNLVIDEPAPLGVSSTLSIVDSSLLLNMSGADEYNIELNGVTTRTSIDSFKLELKTGANTVKVSTDQSCQGVYEESFFVPGKVLSTLIRLSAMQAWHWELS